MRWLLYCFWPHLITTCRSGLSHAQTKSHCCNDPYRIYVVSGRLINTFVRGEVMEVTFHTHATQKTVTAALIYCKTCLWPVKDFTVWKVSGGEQLPQLHRLALNLWERHCLHLSVPWGNGLLMEAFKRKSSTVVIKTYFFQARKENDKQKWLTVEALWGKEINQDKRIRGCINIAALYCWTGSSAAMLLLHCWSKLGQNWMHWVGWHNVANS